MCGSDLHTPLTLHYSRWLDQFNEDASAMRWLFLGNLLGDYMHDDSMVDDPMVTSSVSSIESPMDMERPDFMTSDDDMIIEFIMDVSSTRK